jgi:hypothetical protein
LKCYPTLRANLIKEIFSKAWRRGISCGSCGRREPLMIILEQGRWIWPYNSLSAAVLPRLIRFS